jgi:hypothetical protein
MPASKNTPKLGWLGWLAGWLADVPSKSDRVRIQLQGKKFDEFVNKASESLGRRS